MHFESRGFDVTRQVPRSGIEIPGAFAFETIGIEQLPPAVAKELDYLTSSGSSARALDIDVIRVQNPNDSRTFLYVENDRTAGACFGEAVDEVEGRAIGRTSFTNTDDAAKKMVSVAFTGTDELFRHEGFGERRLLIINQYCKRRYGSPLCSDISLQPSADGLWQKLVKNGLAEKMNTPDGEKRYCFL